MEVNTKMKLDEFTEMMTGHFDNKEQFDKMQAEGKTYPYAEHVNTICNDKINNLPEDFKGKFVVEERKLLIRGSFCLSVIWAILFFVITVTMFLSLAFMGKYMYQLVEPMSRMVFGE